MTKLFLAIPGTQDTRELELEAVRSGVASGEIPLDNWAWSPQRNEWLPLAQLPEFAAAPALAASVPVAPMPVRVEPRQAEPVKVAVPAVAAVRAAAVQPEVAIAARGGKKHAATYYSKPIEEHHEMPIFRVLLAVLAGIIVVLTIVNYYLVDAPMRAAMAKTPFANVTVHAHLGAFVQPGVMLIHVMPNSQITPDNFADLLTALTQSAPRSAIGGHAFQTVSLTPAWFGVYALPVEDWSGFADMSGYSQEEKKKYVLTHLEYLSGQPIYTPARNKSTSEQQADEDRAWQTLVSKFQSAS